VCKVITNDTSINVEEACMKNWYKFLARISTDRKSEPSYIKQGIIICPP